MQPINEQEIQRIRDSYDTNAGGWLSKGWDIFKKDMGSFIGYLLLYFVINITVSMIPVAGSIVAQIIAPALTAGFYIVANAIHKGSNYTFSTFFDGFKVLADLFLSNLIKGVISIILILIPVGLAGFSILSEIDIRDITSDPEFFFIEYFPQLAGYMFIGMIPVLFLNIAWIFSDLLIALRGMKFWDALETSRKVVTKKWLSFFGFMLLLVIVNLAGTLALFIGLLFTIPLSYIAIYVAFENIFGTPEEEDIIDQLIQEDE